MKKIYFLFLMALLPLLASAETMEINGINYNLDPEAKTATVIKKSSGSYSGKIVIPETVTFKSYVCSVKSIKSYAFKGCSGLTSITIPSSVTSIGDCAFQDCSGLTFITIPSSVTFIGLDAFSGTSWYNNQPDGVVYAGKVLYKYKGTMPAGTKISIKEGTLYITICAFQNCTGLTSVTIPNSVRGIDLYVFSGCSGLTSVTIPNSVTYFGDYAFSGCI